MHGRGETRVIKYPVYQGVLILIGVWKAIYAHMGCMT